MKFKLAFVLGMMFIINNHTLAASCDNLFNQIFKSKERKFIENINYRNSLMSSELIELFSKEDSLIEFKLYELKNAFVKIYKRDKNIQQSELKELANHLVSKTSEFLSELNIDHHLLNENEILKIVLKKSGNNRLMKLIKRFEAVSAADIIFSPYENLTEKFRGAFAVDGKRFFLSLDSIMDINANSGEIFAVLKPTDVEWHEFMHARFHSRRRQGIDDVFNTAIIPQKGYRRTEYDNFVSVEELPVHLNQMQQFYRQYKKFVDHFDNYNWDHPMIHEMYSFAQPEHYILKRIRPLAQNTMDFAERMLKAMDESVNFGQTPEGDLAFINGSYKGIFELDGNGVIKLMVTSDYETSITYFHNPHLYARFDGLGRDHAELEQVAYEAHALILDRFTRLYNESFEALKVSAKFYKHYKKLQRALKNGDRGIIHFHLTQLRDFFLGLYGKFIPVD